MEHIHLAAESMTEGEMLHLRTKTRHFTWNGDGGEEEGQGIQVRHLDRLELRGSSWWSVSACLCFMDSLVFAIKLLFTSPIFRDGKKPHENTELTPLTPFKFRLTGCLLFFALFPV